MAVVNGRLKPAYLAYLKEHLIDHCTATPTTTFHLAADIFAIVRAGGCATGSTWLTMCRFGAYHDFHGIGVANLIFGLMCIILPDLALHEEAGGFYDFDAATGDFVKASDAITVINGIFFLAVGICCMVLARRWMENQSIHRLMQITLGLAIVSVVICPITFALNVIATNDASDWAYPKAQADPLMQPPQDDGNDNDTDNSVTGITTTMDPLLTTAATRVFRCDGRCLSTILTLFMTTIRFFEYRIAICAAFTLIAFGSFFMNCALIVLIARTKNFQALKYLPTAEPQLDDVPHIAARSINYQKTDQNNGAVVIQPLPHLPGPVAHNYTNGGTTITHMVP